MKYKYPLHIKDKFEPCYLLFKPLTLLLHLVAIKLNPIVSDLDFGNLKSVNDVLSQEKNDLVGGDICQSSRIGV
jgi:hypothetical protein